MPSRRRNGLLLVPITILAAIACDCGMPAPESKHVARDPDHFLDAQLACDRTRNASVAAIERDDAGDRLFVVSSAQNGEIWEAAKRLADNLPGGRRQPRLAIGAPGSVYLVWMDARAGHVDVYFNRSLDGGRSWLLKDLRLNTNAAAGSHVAAATITSDDHGNIYVVWRDDREGFDAYYANRSRDDGATWLEADRRVTALSLGRKGAPRLACDLNGNVFVAWVEQRDGRLGVFANASSDHAETWMMQDVDLGAAESPVNVELCALETGVVVAAWVERAGKSSQAAVARSVDRGVIWERPHFFGAGRGGVSGPRLRAGAGPQVYVSWVEANAAGGSRIQLQSSSDAGQTYSGLELSRDPGSGPEPFHTTAALYEAPFSMAVDRPGNVYFAWVEAQPGNLRVGFDRVSDFGRTWLRLQPSLDLAMPISVVLGESYPLSAVPSIACDDFGHVVLLWNTGDAMQVAASPFYGDSGWRITSF